MIPSRWVRPTIAATSGILVWLAYLPCFSAFLSDDYVFIEAVRSHHRPWLGWPAGLRGQFFRPVVMASFEIDHALWGLAPWGYHATNLVLHAATAGILVRLGHELTRARSSRTEVAFVAGLYFLAAAPHTEAVSWISGRTDVLVALFSLLALWAYLRFHSTGGRWLVGVACLSLALALLSKESAVMLPLAALSIDAILSGRSEPPPSRRRARWLVLSALFAVTGAYLLVRFVLFGTALGAYPNFRLTLFRVANNLRVFSVRTLVPGTSWTPGLFGLRLDVLGAAAALIFALRTRLFQRPEVWAVAAALFVSLLPVLPLEISLVDTQSERFVYLPSAFAAMLVAFVVDALQVGRCAKNLLLACLIAPNLFALAMANRNWAQAGTVCTQVIDSLAVRLGEAQVRPGQMVFLLNFPDNFRGAYVLRNGFYQALQLRHPDVAVQPPNIVGVSSHGLRNLHDDVTVRVEGEQTLFVSVAPNRFLASPPPTPYYEIRDASDSDFRLRFREGFERGLVLATRKARVVPAGQPGQATNPVLTGRSPQ